MEKVVMAYSGGLDTTAALHWLKSHRGLKVVALAVNVGQGADLDEAGERAIEAGADAVHVVDLRRTFLKQFCFRALRASARYQGAYMLSAALSRPLIATEMVRLAHEEGARYVAHGAPPKGNDQFRFECAVAALDPEMRCIAPLREWHMKDRGEVVEYAERNRLPVGADYSLKFSSDRNLWGVRSSAGVLDDPSAEPPEFIYQVTTNPREAPAEPETVEIEFHQGEPVALNRKRLGAVDLVERLQETAGRHGVGREDTMEDRLLGFKSREVYEAPAAHVLYQAHAALESITLDREAILFKPQLSDRYAHLVYDGQWFTTLRESLDAFFRESQQFVTGTVRVELFKGSARVVGKQSEFSIYDREIANLHAAGGLPAESVAGYLNLRQFNQMNHAFRQRPKL